jgi:hypothetical protein
MGKEEFEEYLAQQNDAVDETQRIDWNTRKTEWLRQLQKFYEQIEDYLANYKNKGVSFEFENKGISEDPIGSYDARRMLVNIKGQEVEFDPVGTNLIGARGRVDMNGRRGTVRFVLVGKTSTRPSVRVSLADASKGSRTEIASKDSEIEWSWKIATPPPRIEYLELNQESFLDSLLEVINV